MPPKKVGKKTKKSTNKKIIKKTTKKTVKSKPKNIVTSTITAQVLTQIPNMVIQSSFSNEGYKIIHNICENAINYHKQYHQIKNCDSVLIKFLLDIEKVARDSNILSEILYVLRARQTLIDKIRQINRIVMSKM